MTNQNRPDAKKNATQAQQQAYEELLRSRNSQRIDRLQNPNIPGFPSREGILQLNADILVGMAEYNRMREVYAQSEAIKLVTDGGAEDAFYETFYPQIEAETRVYQMIPSEALFKHFKDRTLKYYDEQLKSSSLSDEDRKQLEKWKMCLKQSYSFYDFSRYAGVDNSGVLNTFSVDVQSSDETMVDKLNRTKINATLALNYYMEALGSDNLPKLDLSGADFINRTRIQESNKKGKIYLSYELEGALKGYVYIFNLMQLSPRWGDICAFASETTGDQLWLEGAPPIYNKKNIASCLTRDIPDSNEQVKARAIYDHQEYVRRGFLASEFYASVAKNFVDENGYSYVNEYGLPYFTSRENSGNPNLADKNNEDAISNAMQQSEKSLSRAYGDADLIVYGTSVIIGFIPGVGVVRGAGLVGSFVVGGVTFKAIDKVLAYVENLYMSGRIEEAKKILADLNRSIKFQTGDVQRQLNLLQSQDPEKKALQYVCRNFQIDKKLSKYLEKEIAHSGANFFDKEAVEMAFPKSDVNSQLKAEIQSLRESYIEFERQRQELAIYSYCSRVYTNSKVSRNDSIETVMGYNAEKVKNAELPYDFASEEEFYLSWDLASQKGDQKVNVIMDEQDLMRRLRSTIEQYEREYNVLRDSVAIATPPDGSARTIERTKFLRSAFEYRKDILKELSDRLSVGMQISGITENNVEEILKNAKLSLLPKTDMIGSGSGPAAFQLSVSSTKNIAVNKIQSIICETMKAQNEFLQVLYTYAQTQEYIADPKDIQMVQSLFPNRNNRLAETKKYNYPIECLMTEFESELAVLLDMEAVLKTAPDFAIVCQKNGWIGKDGKPDLNKIAPIPNEGKSVEKAMARADAMEKRVLALLKGFESYRYDIIKNNQTEISQSQEQMQSTQSENRSDEVEGDDGVTVASKPPFVELSSETREKIDDYLSKYHNNDVNSPYLGEYAIVKFANNSRNDPEYLATIQYLIAKGADINVTDKYTGRSVLDFMYRHLSPEQLDYFLNENANIDLSVREKDGSTVFYTAFDSHFKSDDKLNVLFESVEDNPEQLSLMLEGALRHGDLEWANNLIEAGADLKSSMPQLLVSAASCSLDIKPLTFLLEHGATIEDFNKALNILNTYDLSPRDKEYVMEHLISVASIEIPETMRISNAIEDKKHYYENLPTDPAVINQKDKYGNTLLMQAVQRADIRAIQHYLTHGADVTLTNNAGKTAFAIAKDGLNEETSSPDRDYSYCAKLLMRTGVSSKKTEESRNLNALIEAVYSGDTAGVKKISAQMPRLNIQTPEGEDVYSAWAKRIIVLINNAENPADIEKISHMDIEDMTQVKGLNKERALLILSHGLTLFPEENGRDTKARELLSQLAIKLVDKMHSIDINCVDEWGNTPLHYACATGDKKLAEALLNRHAFVNVKNALGQTPHDVGVMARTMGNWNSEEAIKKANDMKYPSNDIILPLDRLFYNQKINLSGHVWKYERSDEYDYLLLHLERERHFSQLKQFRGANSHVVERVASVPDELIAFEQQRVQQATAALIAELSVTDRAPNKEKIEALLKAGADANATGELNLSLLQLAILQGGVNAEGVSIVKLLIDHGATVNAGISTGIENLKTGKYKDDSDAQARLDQIKTMIEGALDDKMPHPQPNVSSKIGANAQAVGEGMPRPPVEKER